MAKNKVFNEPEKIGLWRVLNGALSISYCKWNGWSKVHIVKSWLGLLIYVDISKLRIYIDCREDWVKDPLAENLSSLERYGCGVFDSRAPAGRAPCQYDGKVADRKCKGCSRSGLKPPGEALAEVQKVWAWRRKQ